VEDDLGHKCRSGGAINLSCILVFVLWSVLCCAVWCDVSDVPWSRGAGAGAGIVVVADLRFGFAFLHCPGCVMANSVFSNSLASRARYGSACISRFNVPNSGSRHVRVQAVFPSPGFDIPLREKPISISYRSTIFVSPNLLTFTSTIPHDLYTLSILVLYSLTDI